MLSPVTLSDSHKTNPSLIHCMAGNEREIWRLEVEASKRAVSTGFNRNLQQHAANCPSFGGTYLFVTTTSKFQNNDVRFIIESVIGRCFIHSTWTPRGSSMRQKQYFAFSK